MAESPEIKILLVEDSPADARLLQQSLREVSGTLFTVTWVERLADAITKLGEQTFDVGLLDLTLPDSSGPATFTKVLEAFPGLPVVVLTGAADETVGTEAIRRGVQDYLVKGAVSGNTVARVIRYAIERKQAHTALHQLNTELERRVNEIQVANKALQESRMAALNLMDDAVEARKQAEQTAASLQESRIKIEELNTFLKRRAAELSSSYNELQTLTQLLSHDLRVPLRVVSGYSHLLLNEYRDILDASGSKYITMLDKGVQQVNQLLDSVLLLSGISRKQMWLQRVNLSALAREVAEDLRKSQPERKADIIIQDNVQEWADQGFMKQVLHNLFENALKFTYSREMPRIEFGTLNGQTPQTCFVRDNGIGFDTKDAAKLFTPFHRFTSSNESAAAGVGLAIVERIIQRHGGKVWAEGEKGKGAVFYFKLG
jgi:signal transduction histidine kinase